MGQVFSQLDARLFTNTVSSANLIQGAYERFDLMVGTGEAPDRIGERPACGRILAQKFLPYRLNHL